MPRVSPDAADVLGCRRVQEVGAGEVDAVPGGALTVSRCEARNQITGIAKRARRLSIRIGTSPLSGPESHVGCVLEVSIAMSAPELPAPTISTPPGASWDRSRYSLECIWTI